MELDKEPSTERDTMSSSTLMTERLFKARTLIISGEINQRLAASVTTNLLALAAESSADITLFINSQGGHVESGDTIHDLIRFLTPKVRIVGTGWVASAGALIFVSVPKELRFCLPNSCSTSRRAGRGGRRATSRSRRGRSCACGTASTGSSRAKPGSHSSASRRIPAATSG
jgi:ATP-dependent Clp endopeptidase proteolytic subunit ClpP